MRVAPTEPAALRALGKVSLTPERFGVDVLMVTKLGTLGIQRKEVSDLLASIDDGRLRKESDQAQVLACRVLLIEGKLRWTNDGLLLRDFGRAWKRTELDAYLLSRRLEGWWVVTTCDLDGTVEMVSTIQRWANKDKHQVAGRGDRVKADSWGKVTSRAYRLHVLTSLPDIGPELAERILDHFGRMPVGWTVTKEELMEVKGVGVKKAERMWRALEEA